MSKKDFLRKISSRRFWCGLMGCIIGLLTAFNIDNLTIEQIIAIVTATSSLTAFILGESYVDGKRAEAGEGEFEEVIIKYKDKEDKE